MKRGAHVIYAGPLGHHSHKLIEYFEAVAGVPKIKDGYNPATWMLDISTPSIEAQLDEDFAKSYLGSTLHRACFWKQYWSYWRNPQYNAVRFFMTIVMGVIFGLIFWNKAKAINKQQDLFDILGAMYAAVLFLGIMSANAVLPVVDVERTVLYREQAAGMYSAMSYAFGQVAIEAIYIAIQTAVYSLLLFSMIGFEWKAGNFLWFYYFIVMCFIYFTLYGMMVVALTPNHTVAAICMAFFVSFWNLFSGFLIPRVQIPIWWRGYYWCSPVAWTVYGLVTSQLGHINAKIEMPGGGSMFLKDLLKQSLGFHHDFLPVVAIVHVGWVLLFLFVFATCIKLLNFQKR